MVSKGTLDWFQRVVGGFKGCIGQFHRVVGWFHTVRTLDSFIGCGQVRVFSVRWRKNGYWILQRALTVFFGHWIVVQGS